MNEPINFMPLHEVVSFEDYDFNGRLEQQEKEILQPQLEALGYTNISWEPGDEDSFGPLVRVCKAYLDGKLIHLVYG